MRKPRRSNQESTIACQFPPSVTGSSLQWNINGDENTVDHYTVYISADGQNLMPLTDLATGMHSLNFAAFRFLTANTPCSCRRWASRASRIRSAEATNFTSTCAPASTAPSPTPTPTLSFSASPATITIPAGLSGTFTVIAKPQSGSFNSAIALSCGSLPATLSCSFSPASITPGAAAPLPLLPFPPIPSPG